MGMNNTSGIKPKYALVIVQTCTFIMTWLFLFFLMDVGDHERSSGAIVPFICRSVHHTLYPVYLEDSVRILASGKCAAPRALPNSHCGALLSVLCWSRKVSCGAAGKVWCVGSLFFRFYLETMWSCEILQEKWASMVPCLTTMVKVIYTSSLIRFKFPTHRHSSTVTYFLILASIRAEGTRALLFTESACLVFEQVRSRVSMFSECKAISELEAAIYSTVYISDLTESLVIDAQERIMVVHSLCLISKN